MNFDELDSIAMNVANAHGPGQPKPNWEECKKIAMKEYNCDWYHAEIIADIVQEEYN